MDREEGLAFHSPSHSSPVPNKPYKMVCVDVQHYERRKVIRIIKKITLIVQELCESRGGRPGLSVLTSLLVSVDVKIY